MGIKGLNAFLRAKCPGAFVELPNSYFRNKRIAVDSNNVLFKLMSRAHKEIVNKTDVAVKEPDREEITRKWIYHVKNFVLDLLRVGATPIFVFDGEYIIEKSKTQQKRRDDKQKMIRDAEDYKAKLDEIDELERTPAMVTELRKKMQNLSSLPTEDKELIMSILSGAGLPVMVATGEGEKLCAMLCVEGKVDAVYSRDTDLVAFGCPLTINEPSGYVYNPDTRNVEESLKCTMFSPILEALKMEYETFIDLCIMSGCDFNDNIFRVGVGKAYKELLVCRNIENLPAKYQNRSECLKHVRCREIFKHMPSHLLCNGELVLNINTDLTNMRDVLEMYGADSWIADLAPIYKNLVQPHNNGVTRLPTRNKPKVFLKINNNGNPDPPVPPVPVLNGGKSSPQRLTNKDISNINQIQLNNLKLRQQESKQVRKPTLNIVVPTIAEGNIL